MPEEQHALEIPLRRPAHLLPITVRWAVLGALLWCIVGAIPARRALALEPSPAAASATGKNCLGEPRLTVWADQTLIGIVNPLGAEHQLRIALCVPLVTRPGILFDYTNLEVGLVHYTSPVYVHQGGYLALTPLSFLVVGVEATGIVAWPIPLDGAGYFPVSGYGADYRDTALPSEKGRGATGWNVILFGTLRGEVRLSRRLSLVAASAFSADLWSFGNADYYVNLRRDVILAREDWVIKNNALLQVEIVLSPNVNLRLGATDDLTWVPRSGYTANLVAGLATLVVHRLGKGGRELQPFVRVGGYTQHAFREPLTAMVGIGITWDLYRGAPR